MVGYIAGRLAQAVPVLLIASIAVFLVLRLVPGDPAEALAGSDVTDERVAEVREQLGLTDSLPRQYARWMGNLVQGDFGQSFSSSISVGRFLADAVNEATSPYARRRL